MLRERKTLFETIFLLKINREKVCAGERPAHLKDHSRGFVRTHREAGCEEIEPLFKGLCVGSREAVLEAACTAYASLGFLFITYGNVLEPFFMRRSIYEEGDCVMVC